MSFAKLDSTAVSALVGCHAYYRPHSFVAHLSPVQPSFSSLPRVNTKVLSPVQPRVNTKVLSRPACRDAISDTQVGLST